MTNDNYNIRVQPLLNIGNDETNDIQVRLYRAIYYLAFKLFLDYTTVPRKGYKSPFIFEHEPFHVNVLYTCDDTNTEDYYAIEHGNELDITRYLCSDIPLKEYRKIFGNDMSETEMYRKVFDTVCGPTLFTSNRPILDIHGRDIKITQPNIYELPTIVLHVAERMINDRYNSNWIHYYCINKESFEQYKRIISGEEQKEHPGIDLFAMSCAFNEIVFDNIHTEEQTTAEDELVVGHSKTHYNIC